MRVVVANLTAGGLSGGYRKYLIHLMPLLAADPRIRNLTIILPRPASDFLGSAVEVRRWNPEDALCGYTALARLIREVSPDVVFVPTSRHVRFPCIPVVTMVRNMEPLSVPIQGNTLRDGLRNVLRAWEARRASRAAARVIAVSQHVREFVISRWSLDASRVGLAYHGVEPIDLSDPSTGRTRTVLTAGSIRPYRGLEDLICAAPSLPLNVRVVIAGAVDPGCETYGRRLRQLADRTGATARITWAGQLDRSAMTREFAAATVFVMTSRAEACPNTALEAMSAGRPTVSVDVQPMPEFFGVAARYYMAGDVGALARQLNALLAAPSELQRLGHIARERSRAFTWEATRDRTIHELRSAIDDRPIA